MGGRVYDPLAARFTTADPIMQAPYWSQGQNRYAYVFNDPINFTDPSGFITTGTTGGDIATGTVFGTAGAILTYGIATEIGKAGISLSMPGVSGLGAAGGLGGGVTNAVGTLLGNPFQGSGPSTVSVAAPSGTANTSPVKPGGTSAVGQASPPGASNLAPRDGAGPPGPSARQGSEGGRADWNEILKKVRWQKSEELAAYIFLDAANPPSIQYNREVYTLIVRKNGKFATIPAQVGSANRSDGFWEYYQNFLDGAPADTQVSAWAHTHGIYDGAGSNDFSSDDVDITKRVGTAYLGTPSGRFKVLQPGQNFGTDLGSLPPCRCYVNP